MGGGALSIAQPVLPTWEEEEVWEVANLASRRRHPM